MLITKADGTQEEFSEQKLIASIKRAGVSQDLQIATLAHVKSKLHEDIKTSEIYNHIVEFLGHSSQPFTKSRFSIKEALKNLGPTGYPFEDYVASLLRHMGYQTQVRVIAQGKCISHEIDVVGKKDEQQLMIEVKYHNTKAVKTDVHVALYVQARFEDVKDKNDFTQAMLITNTKLTTDAITYGQCVNMQLVGWSYPEGEGLKDLVDRYQLFPITTLTELTISQQQQLLSEGVILCKDICTHPEAIDNLNLPQDKKEQILKEANFVCDLIRS